jgi:methylamine dehydrogenase heavy chain
MALAGAIASASIAPARAAPIASVEPEQSDVAQLTPPQPSWFFINRGFTENSSAIYDTVTGKLLGHVETPQLTDLALDPAGKFYYVSSTLWTKASRGTRQDYVSVFDSVDLKLQADIPMPGRLLVGGRMNNFVISPDGKFGYVYNMSPASSVNVIDLAARKFVKTVELPGCASLVAVPGVGCPRCAPMARWPRSRWPAPKARSPAANRSFRQPTIRSSTISRSTAPRTRS